MSWECDVILVGASGYIAQRVLERAVFEEGMQLGIAARSREALEALNASSIVRNEHMFLVDEYHQEALVKIATKARCVMNCSRHHEFGERMIRACIEAGANYIDISGDQEFIFDVKKKYDQLARRAGVLIVSGCGWSSIPSDAMFWFLYWHLTPQQREMHLTLQTAICSGKKNSSRLVGSLGGIGHGTMKALLDGWFLGKGVNVTIDPLSVGKQQQKRKLHPGRIKYFPQDGVYGVRNELFSDPYVVRSSYLGLHQNLSQASGLSRRGSAASGGGSKRRISRTNMKPNRFEYNHYFGASFLLSAYLIAIFLWLGPLLLRNNRKLHSFLSRFLVSDEGPSEKARKSAQATIFSHLHVYDDDGKVVRKLDAVAKVPFDPNEATAIIALRTALLISREQHSLPTGCGVVTSVQAFKGRILQVVAPVMNPMLKTLMDDYSSN